MNVNSIISHCKSLGFYDLQNYAGANFNIVYNHLKDHHSNINPNHVLVRTIVTCIAVDGKLSEKEWNFIACFVGGYSYDEALNMAGEFYNDEARDIARKFYREFPLDVREAYAKMCIAVLCVDYDVNYAEKAFINQIIG